MSQLQRVVEPHGALSKPAGWHGAASVREGVRRCRGEQRAAAWVREEVELDLNGEVLLAMEDQEVRTSDPVVASIGREPSLSDDGDPGGDRRHGGLLRFGAARRLDPDHCVPHGIGHGVEHRQLMRVAGIDPSLLGVASLSPRQRAKRGIERVLQPDGASL